MRLKQLREKADITQFEACTVIKVSIATLSRWESGDSRVPADVVSDLAQLYKVSETEILKALKHKKGA